MRFGKQLRGLLKFVKIDLAIYENDDVIIKTTFTEIATCIYLLVKFLFFRYADILTTLTRYDVT